MPIKYTSRSGNIYYLHVGKTKTGRQKFYFSTKKDGELTNKIPEGYEIYENLNAQVFLRRVQAKIINNDEIKIVKDELAKRTKPMHYKADIKKNIITIHQVNQDLEGLRKIWPSFAMMNFQKFVEQRTTYSPILRFILQDDEKRLFIAERYCFLGSVDDWIFIGGPASLEKLSKRFIRHLGKDSFFELY